MHELWIEALYIFFFLEMTVHTLLSLFIVDLLVVALELAVLPRCQPPIILRALSVCLKLSLSDV